MNFILNNIRDFQAAKKLKAICHANSLKSIDRSELAKYSDRPFYILGCGSTINDITADQWKIVEQGFSVGMNKWLIHDFIPDAVSFEKQRSIPIYEKLLMSDRITGSRLKFIFYPMVSLAGSRPAFHVTESIISKFRIHTAARMIINTEGDLESFVRDAFFLEKISKQVERGLIYEQKGSVYRLIQIALSCGFKNIVFCGVDLNNTKYFWDEHPQFFTNRGIEVIKPAEEVGIKHNTDVATSVSLAISDVIRILHTSLKTRGIEFWTSSGSSKLASFLPVWNF